MCLGYFDSCRLELEVSEACLPDNLESIMPEILSVDEAEVHRQAASNKFSYPENSDGFINTCHHISNSWLVECRHEVSGPSSPAVTEIEDSFHGLFTP